MSDREFGGNDDLSLPKGAFHLELWSRFRQLTRPATVQKIVQDILATEPGMTFAKDSRDLLIECCVEFITLISSEANEIAEKDAKKTIACEHVKAALEELDFGEYVPAILEVAQDYKKQQQVRVKVLNTASIDTNTSQNREKKQTKIEQSGMTEEELIRAQEELFRSATDKFNSAPS
jgi:histone H3/H4